MFGRPVPGAKMPLLVIYSSDLEERHLTFWYRSIRGQQAVAIPPSECIACSVALESFCQSKPISQIFWMKLEMAVFSSTSFPVALGEEVLLTCEVTVIMWAQLRVSYSC